MSNKKLCPPKVILQIKLGLRHRHFLVGERRIVEMCVRFYSIVLNKLSLSTPPFLKKKLLSHHNELLLKRIIQIL